MVNSKQIVEEYLHQSDWRVKENSNSPFSYGGLGKYVRGEVFKDYWLRHIYSEDISTRYVSGDIHIHDLNDLTVYCCGYSLDSIIRMGVKGVPNIPVSNPAKHFASILNQLSNLITVFQNEIAGAVAFSSVDTLLAPFIKIDKLSYDEVKQCLQNFIFSINSNSRSGAEPAFSNITLDLTPPSDLIDLNCVIGGNNADFTYRDCQEEMDVFNKAFAELMIVGDSNGRPHAYPIPTYNIHERFDWDNPNNEIIFKMAGKYGYPYFANFINSDMDVSDARSMCCRLRIDKRELIKRNGGLFGAGDSTGSIGVVTLNMPRYGYLAKSEEDLFHMIRVNMDIARKSLDIKREWLNENCLKNNMIPAFNTYVGTFENHFSTIGLVGLNEMCLNFIGEGINTESGKALSIEVLKFMRDRLQDYQEESGGLYNLEATPAESTCYRLAKKDVETYTEIITQGTKGTPYYTNSCHLPVGEIKDISHLFDHQNDLQALFTGGTVVHIYMGDSISSDQAKHIIKTVCEKYSTPYVSISPLNHYCPKCGYLEHAADNCPKCGSKIDKYQRITGYLRNVEHFNIGKKAEFENRKQLSGNSL